MKRDAIVIKMQDNVATAIHQISEGNKAVVGVDEFIERVTALQSINQGHKLARYAIAKGKNIIKYGTVIGRATKAIQKGEHVHVHNVESLRGGGDIS